jgi:pimeloyl-ACP methyl ester carboxylesterase
MLPGTAYPNTRGRLNSLVFKGVFSALHVEMFLSEIVTRKFSAGPVELAYLDEGEGEPIVLVHGFASNKEVNWVLPGWVATLRSAGRRAIALDNRGHGASTKLYQPALYHTDLMADDIRALLDHLRLARADVMGYSMGARNTAFLARVHGERVRSAILGGLGIQLVK